MIQLDTSFLIRSFVRDTVEDRSVRRWLRDGEELGVSSIAWAQFLCGPVSHAAAAVARTFLDEPLPFGDDEAICAARLFNETGRRKGSFADCLIAATAIQHDAAIATSNPSDFSRFEPLGLRLHAAE